MSHVDNPPSAESAHPNPPSTTPQDDTALPDTAAHSTSTPAQPIEPSEYVFQLILEQFWGDGVSKREIRSVYTTAHDANAACQDYLLRTCPREKFSMYELGVSPQRPELAKVSAQINGDRFHVWIERHPWEGALDFSSKAIAKRAGKGPNAYILQRTIKDAEGGKRRSTTRGIFATRQLAKQALAHDEPPAEWSSNQGYILEPGGEYAHALSPSGKAAWLFIEVRPLFMSYGRMDQEEQEEQIAAKLSTKGASAMHPISLDGMDETLPGSIPASPSTLLSVQQQSLHHHHQSLLDNPYSPMPSNPDEAGAYVYLVLQLKTLPYTPPILTVEAVTYEMEVANRFGINLLKGFGGPETVFEPIFREDGCLQGNVEQRAKDEGLTVWVERRAVVLGQEGLDYDLMSEHGSLQSSRMHSHPPDEPVVPSTQKREEPADGFDVSASVAKMARTLPSGGDSTALAETS